MPTIGWDGPVRHRWKFDLLSLARHIASYAPVKTGRLRRDVGSLKNYRVLKLNGRDAGVEANYSTPYAAIQDQGGYVGSVYGRLMTWITSEGERIFRTSRSGFRLAGYKYVERGVSDWLQDATGIKVNWEDKHGI